MREFQFTHLAQEYLLSIGLVTVLDIGSASADSA